MTSSATPRFPPPEWHRSVLGQFSRNEAHQGQSPNRLIAALCLTFLDRGQGLGEPEVLEHSFQGVFFFDACSCVQLHVEGNNSWVYRGHQTG